MIYENHQLTSATTGRMGFWDTHVQFGHNEHQQSQVLVLSARQKLLIYAASMLTQCMQCKKHSYLCKEKMLIAHIQNRLLPLLS